MAWLVKREDRLYLKDMHVMPVKLMLVSRDWRRIVLVRYCQVMGVAGGLFSIWSYEVVA